MSAESVARWNAIPIGRQESSTVIGIKRSREDDDDNDVLMDDGDSDDSISLVSRSPSPPPDDMQVDKYDEFIPGEAREVITVETKIKSTNKGFSMLSKLGWSEGQPLGITGDGRVDPVPFHLKRDLTGLGKSSQDARMIETTVSQRRGLDSERQQKETEDQRRFREDIVARRAAVQAEVSETLRPFYCSVCDKQFQNVAQYDEHTNSYAHHHKIRFRDMQLSQRQKQNTQEELERRKAKERKREEKELRKIAAAAGVKMAKSATVAPVIAPVPAPDEGQPSKGGWASVFSPPAEIPPSSSGLNPTESARTSSSTPPPDSSHTRSSSSATSNLQAPPPSHPAPAFRTGGWSNLDTTSPAPTPPPSQYDSPSSLSNPAPPSMSPLGSWTSHLPAPQPSAPSGFRPLPSEEGLSSMPPSERASHPPAATVPPVTAKPSAAKKDQAREKSRTGWQAFQRGGRRK